jgi:ATP-dependent Clp protease ATP-binding subunit ClpC
MFERFDKAARRVVVLAQEEARFLKHNYIGTEHLLLQLVPEEKRSIYRERILANIGEGTHEINGHIPFTPNAKKGLEQAFRESLALGHNVVTPDHLRLGIAGLEQGVGIELLGEWKIDLMDSARTKLKERPPDPPTPEGPDEIIRQIERLLLRLKLMLNDDGDDEMEAANG